MRGEKRPWTILQQKTNTGWFLYWEPQSRLADITRDALKFRGLISNPTQPQNGAALPPQFEKRRLKPSPVERGTHAPSPRPRGGHSLSALTPWARGACTPSPSVARRWPAQAPEGQGCARRGGRDSDSLRQMVVSPHFYKRITVIHTHRKVAQDFKIPTTEVLLTLTLCPK